MNYVLCMGLILIITRSGSAKPEFCKHQPTHQMCLDEQPIYRHKFCRHQPSHPQCKPPNEARIAHCQKHFWDPTCKGLLSNKEHKLPLELDPPREHDENLLQEDINQISSIEDKEGVGVVSEEDYSWTNLQLLCYGAFFLVVTVLFDIWATKVQEHKHVEKLRSLCVFENAEDERNLDPLKQELYEQIRDGICLDFHRDVEILISLKIQIAKELSSKLLPKSLWIAIDDIEDLKQSLEHSIQQNKKFNTLSNSPFFKEACEIQLKKLAVKLDCTEIAYYILLSLNPVSSSMAGEIDVQMLEEQLKKATELDAESFQDFAHIVTESANVLEILKKLEKTPSLVEDEEFLCDVGDLSSKLKVQFGRARSVHKDNQHRVRAHRLSIDSPMSKKHRRFSGEDNERKRLCFDNCEDSDREETEDGEGGLEREIVALGNVPEEEVIFRASTEIFSQENRVGEAILKYAEMRQNERHHNEHVQEKALHRRQSTAEHRQKMGLKKKKLDLDEKKFQKELQQEAESRAAFQQSIESGQRRRELTFLKNAVYVHLFLFYAAYLKTIHADITGVCDAFNLCPDDWSWIVCIDASYLCKGSLSLILAFLLPFVLVLIIQFGVLAQGAVGSIALGLLWKRISRHVAHLAPLFLVEGLCFLLIRRLKVGRIRNFLKYFLAFICQIAVFAVVFSITETKTNCGSLPVVDWFLCRMGQLFQEFNYMYI